MSYRPRLTPFDHQLRAREALEARPAGKVSDAFAYFCEMGTGKTKMVLDEWGAGVAAGKFNGILVVAPAGSYRNWFADRGDDLPSEFRKHLDPSLFVLTTIRHWRSGMTRKAQEDLIQFLDRPTWPKALVVNIEALSQRGTEGRISALEVCEKFLASGRVMMVVDESTRIKTEAARRTKNVLGLGQKAVARRLMSGLPTPKTPLDLYYQFEFLDWQILGYSSFYAFKARYAIEKKIEANNRKIWITVGYRHTEELQGLIAPYTFRCLKEECLDLPPKVYQIAEYVMPPKLRKIYDDFKEASMVELESGDWVSSTMPMTKILRLHQIAAGYAVDETNVKHEFTDPRIEVVLETLEDFDGKAIIWAPYDVIIQNLRGRLAKVYGHAAVAQFSGSNATSRMEDETRFLSDPDCRFMVSTPAAGGVGNNWTVANLVIYYANNYDLEHRLQSEDRAHRSGQTRSVTYVDVVARGTVDETILRALRKKIDMAASVVGDGWREWII